MTATNVDHDHLPSRATIFDATDDALTALDDLFADHAWDCPEPACARIAGWTESELDARALATSDDARVRESVGVFDA